MCSIFSHACEDGNIPVIELLLSQGHKDIEIGFEGACRGGKLEIAKWMVKLGAQNLINGFKIAYLDWNGMFVFGYGN